MSGAVFLSHNDMGMHCRRFLLQSDITYLLAFAVPLAKRLTRPLILEVKNQLHKLLVAFSLIVAGMACAILGLSYLASSLWHALVPAVGTVEAELLLGGAYGAIAVILLAIGFNHVR